MNKAKNLTTIFGLYKNIQNRIDSYIPAHIYTCIHTVHAVLVIIERLVYCSQCSFLYEFGRLKICKCTYLQCLYVEKCFYEIVCNKLFIQLGKFN